MKILKWVLKKFKWVSYFYMMMRKRGKKVFMVIFKFALCIHRIDRWKMKTVSKDDKIRPTQHNMDLECNVCGLSIHEAVT